LTAPIGRDFEDAEKVFQEVLRNGNGNVEGMKIPA